MASDALAKAPLNRQESAIFDSMDEDNKENSKAIEESGDFADIESEIGEEQRKSEVQHRRKRKVSKCSSRPISSASSSAYNLVVRSSSDLSDKSASSPPAAAANKTSETNEQNADSDSSSSTSSSFCHEDPTSFQDPPSDDNSLVGLNRSHIERLKQRESRERTTSSSSNVKLRKKRKRHVDEHEKIMAYKSKTLDALFNKPSTYNDNANSADAERLRDLAVGEGGLLNDDYRRRVWPLLAGVRVVETEILPSQSDCEGHPEYKQVVLDVDRSLKRFPPCITDQQRPELQDQLTRLIVRVLIKCPGLHYYQGYHDVAITFLLVVGEEMGYRIMVKLSKSHLESFMTPNMEKTTFLLNYMYPIIKRRNPELFDFLEASEVGTIFALPWVITWFGHVLPEYEDVVRLYDFFLAQPPMMPVYLATALVLHREKEILLADCDMPSVHSLLTRIPVNLPFEYLLEDAIELYEDYPPDSLEGEVVGRMARLKLEMERARQRVAERKAKLQGDHQSASSQGKRSRGFSSLLAKGFVLVAVPVIAGVVIYRYMNN